jgi:hypothetical protein
LSSKRNNWKGRKMRDDRTAFLLKKQEMGLPLTDAERRELADTPEFVGERDASGNLVGGAMVVPRRPTGAYEQQLEQFAKLMYMDNHEPSADEVAAFVSGKPVGTSHDQAPDVVDEWATDEPPVEPTAAPVTPPPVAAPVAEPSPMPATEAPVGNDAPALPPGHTFVRFLPDGRIVAAFKDPSYPRSPAREVVLDPKRLRKDRARTARAAMVMRRASDDGSKRITRF